MNEQVKKLCDILNFKKKLTYGHDFEGQLLPFFTREPERMKFTNGFNPVIGVISRIINGKGEEFQKSDFEIDNTSLDTTISEDTVKSLFSPEMYRGMNSSKLLQYLPLSTGKDKKGEIRVSEFLIELLRLKDNPEFIEMFKDNEPSNLYEKIVFESLENEEKDSSGKPRPFKFYDRKNYFSKYFDKDIKNLKKDNEYFYTHIGELLEFYYFTYVIQTTMRISNGNISQKEEIIPMFFNLGNESVSQSRKSMQQGYNLAYQHSQGLLMDIDILNYLNVLIPEQGYFYWKNEILAEEFAYKDELLQNLKEFISEFKQQLNSEVLEDIDFQFEDLNGGMQCLRSLLETRKDKSPDSRYAKSFTAISQQNYSRNHGRFGKAFSLSNQTVLLLTSAIVGHGKMLLNQVFQEFENRGIFFDRITRDGIIVLFEQANILEKLSDSGDAQYVRGIL